MAKVEQYRQLIQELLLAYSEIKGSNEEVEAEANIRDRAMSSTPLNFHNRQTER